MDDTNPVLPQSAEVVLNNLFLFKKDGGKGLCWDSETTEACLIHP